jgi:hypothetical protein
MRKEERAMKTTLTALLTTISAMALSLALAPTALAHGGADDGHADPGGPLGALLIPPEFVLGGVALFGVLYALRRRGG